MKTPARIALLTTVLLASGVHAAEEMALNWSLSSLEFNGRLFDQLELDVEQGIRFFRANGILAGSQSLDAIIPVTGTCVMLSGSESVLCHFALHSHVLELKIGTNLGGEYFLLRENQTTAANGMLYYTGIQ